MPTRKYADAWYAKNREKVLKRQREDRLKKTYQKLWHVRHRSILTDMNKRRILVQLGGRCAQCGQDGGGDINSFVFPVDRELMRRKRWARVWRVAQAMPLLCNACSPANPPILCEEEAPKSVANWAAINAATSADK